MGKIVLIYKNKLFSYDGNKLDSITVKEAKKYRVGASFNSKKLITLSFKLPKNLSKEQLSLQVELKLYKDGGLNPNENYKIDFVTYDLESERELIVEAFAVAYEDLSEFEEYAKKIGYIDILFPRFIAYAAIYENISHTNDLIVYLGEDEAFGAIYKEGKYIGYRIIDDLATISKKCGLELAKLKSVLKERGLVKENYPLEEMHLYDALVEIFSKNIEKLIYAVNFKRTYFGFDRIDRVLIDFEGSNIKGIERIFYNLGFYEDAVFKLFECCGKKEHSSLYVLAHYIYLYDNLPYRLNFSIFNRKKPFYKYESFKILAAFATILALLGGTYIYLDQKVKRLDGMIEGKKRELKELERKEKKFVEQIKGLKKEKKELQTTASKLRESVDTLENTLSFIPFIQQNRLEREKFINDIVEGLYRYGLKADKIEQNGTKAVLVDIISGSNQRENIASFMKFLYSKGYKRVDTKEIVGQEGLYKSVVRVQK